MNKFLAICFFTIVILTPGGAFAQNDVNLERIPVAATLDLHSYKIPISRSDPAHTALGLYKNPAIYLDMTFADGTAAGVSTELTVQGFSIGEIPRVTASAQMLAGGGSDRSLLWATIANQVSPSVAIADLIGTYERFPVENDSHVGELQQNGALVRWTNRYGATIDLTPDLANQRLLPDDLSAAFWIGPREFTLIVTNGQIEGFIYNGGKYKKRGFKPAATAVRFIDNGDGTVTDSQSSLIWLKDASCSDLIPPDHFQTNFAFTRDDALKAASELRAGLCGLTDKSKAGDWRLPTAAEFCGSWDSNTVGFCQKGGGLINPKFNNPALSNGKGDARWTEGDVFNGVVHDGVKGYHTSSPTMAGTPDAEGPLGNETIWRIFMKYGKQEFSGFPDGLVWPVRR